MYSPPKPKLYQQTYVFEVGYNGGRYLIDGCYTYPGLYEGTSVPYEVAKMSDDAVSAAFRSLDDAVSDEDARDLTQKALESVFDDVRLVKDDYPYGAIF